MSAMAVELQRVLISDAVDSSCKTILEEGGVAVDYRPGLSRDELLTCIKVCCTCVIIYVCTYVHGRAATRVRVGTRVCADGTWNTAISYFLNSRTALRRSLCIGSVTEAPQPPSACVSMHIICVVLRY